MSGRWTKTRARLPRRAFLSGVGGITIGLPFLESQPERSAWAADEQPVFAMFIGTSNGVIGEHFWPWQMGSLAELGSDPSAVGLLADYADQLLIPRGLRYPGTLQGDTHATSYPQMLTGAPPAPAEQRIAKATAASLDVLLAPVLNTDGAPPLTLYSGMKPGYIDEAMSWTAEGKLRAAEGNPLVVYTALVDSTGTNTDLLSHAVLVRRQSAIDLARDELLRFQGRGQLSGSDRTRLEQHLSALRDVERSLGEQTGALCSNSLLDLPAIEAANDTYRQNGQVEVISRLQLDLAAFAFACNINHVATLQSGDGQDSTTYDVPSNARQWSFHHISHQIQSDASTGTDPLAVQAHVEIDRLRMETFAHGLRQFDAHGLLDKTVIMWANQFTEGRSGGTVDLPILLAGNPYGRLRSGRQVDYAPRTNGELLTSLAQVLGLNQTIGSATQGIDDLLA